MTMKKVKAILVYVLTLVIVTSSLIPVQNVFAANSIVFKFYNQNVTTPSSTIYPNFKIINNGTTDFDLSTVKLRYYFTKDTSETLNFAIDSVPQGVIASGAFYDISNATNADKYFEISFSSGTVIAGGQAEIKTRIFKTGYINFNQSNDYSFNSSAQDYVDWN